MARTTIMTVSMRDLASHGAVLTLSALAHVLVYGGLSLVPASAPPPRTSLIVTELIVTEPSTPSAPQPITPPRLLARLKPRAKPAESAAPTPTAPARPTQVEPPIERETATLQIETAPPLASSAETPREVAAASPPTIMPSSFGSATPSSSSSAPLSITSSSSGPAASMIIAARTGSAAVVAALPPAPPAVATPVTRSAIPRGGYQVTPSYPASARRLGIEGTALLRVLVDATGHVGDVLVKHSAGHPDLDRAAADAVRRWRFDPARRGADAVAMWVELPVEFHLR